MGHTVYTADSTRFHICRYSKAVKKNFIVPSPRFEPKKFIDRLVEIVEREKIDLIIPTFEEIFCFSKDLHRFPKSCKIFSTTFQVLDQLHNKWLFNEKLHHMGITAPESYLVKTKEDFDTLPLKFPYIIKPCYSRAAQRVIKVQDKKQIETVLIDPHNPWVAQEWLKGKKLCTYSIANQGKLSAHAVYPLEFSIDESSCLNFEAIEHPAIEEWVKNFVEKEKFTGQVGFDFIELDDGSLYPIECNPRSTSGLHLFRKEDHLPLAFFNETLQLIKPKIGFSKQVAIGMLLYGWKTKHPQKNYSHFIKKLLSVQDVIFSRHDLSPFLIQPFLFVTYIVRCLKLRMRIPSMFTFDIDWNGDAHSMHEQMNYKLD